MCMNCYYKYMTKAINTASIEKATSKTWSEWVQDLNQSDASDLTHMEISRLVSDRLQGVVDNPDWWAQSITVAYEQEIGKRIPGQLANGLFELAVSKVILKPRSELFPQLVEWFEGQTDFNGKLFLKPRSSETPKRSNWRCDFEDDSKFALTVEENGEKSKLVLSHTAVPSAAEAEAWKEYWRSVIDSVV